MALFSHNLTLDELCCIENMFNPVKQIEMNHLKQAALQCLNTTITTKGIVPLLIQVLKNKSEHFPQGECPTTPPINWECIEPVQTTSVLYAAFWIVVMVLTLAMNSVVIYAICTKRYLKSSVTNSFISSLAVSDILVAVCIIPIKIRFALRNPAEIMLLDLIKEVVHGSFKIM